MNILINKISVLGVVEVDLVGLGLPVSRENHKSLGFHFLSDLLADGLKDGVGGVFRLILDIRLGGC
jgi:hypothetical protein